MKHAWQVTTLFVIAAFICVPSAGGEQDIKSPDGLTGPHAQAASFISGVLLPELPPAIFNHKTGELQGTLDAQVSAIANWVFSGRPDDVKQSIVPVTLQFTISGDFTLDRNLSVVQEIKELKNPEGQRIGIMTWCYVPLENADSEAQVTCCAIVKGEDNSKSSRILVKTRTFRLSSRKWIEKK